MIHMNDEKNLIYLVLRNFVPEVMFSKPYQLELNSLKGTWQDSDMKEPRHIGRCRSLIDYCSDSKTKNANRYNNLVIIGVYDRTDNEDINQYLVDGIHLSMSLTNRDDGK